jgi:hypothetical protein
MIPTSNYVVILYRCTKNTKQARSIYIIHGFDSYKQASSLSKPKMLYVGVRTLLDRWLLLSCIVLA